jgi:hypothetical protein
MRGSGRLVDIDGARLLMMRVSSPRQFGQSGGPLDLPKFAADFGPSLTFSFWYARFLP